MKRKIAAILAADVAGYAQLITSDEDRTLTQLAAGKAQFSKLIVQHEGRVFNSAGDQLLAEFPSAVEAVRCAVAVQKVMDGSWRGSSPCQLRFRIGITVGDVVERNGDLFGDGVNIAARLQSVIGGGGICISRGVFEQVGNRVGATFTNLGPQKLKNMPDPVQAYLVLPSGSPAGGGVAGVASAASATTLGLVVSPIHWVGGGAVLLLAALLIWRAVPTGREVARPLPSPSQGPEKKPDTSPAKVDVPTAEPERRPSDIVLPHPGRTSAQCRDILERAQLGQLSAYDRILLEKYCK